jgi:alpha-glucosidase
MGNEKPHEIKLPLAFLGAGRFNAKIYEDGATPVSLNESTRDVTPQDTVVLKLAPSGGAAVSLRRK